MVAGEGTRERKKQTSKGTTSVGETDLNPEKTAKNSKGARVLGRDEEGKDGDGAETLIPSKKSRQVPADPPIPPSSGLVLFMLKNCSSKWK